MKPGEREATSAEEITTRHITGVRFEDLSAQAIRSTKEHIMHTLGTVLAGSAAAGSSPLMDMLLESGGRAESTVLGWGVQLPSHTAALANSTMAHAQEFDCNDDRIAYKSSTCAVPAGLAVGERVAGTTGRDMLTAVCVGIDLGIRMGLSIDPQPAHPEPGNLGAFAAAFTSAKLLKLDASGTWDALGLALCGVLSQGLAVSADSYTKRYLAGLAAHNGVMAAVLASKGFRAHQSIFSGARGFYQGLYKREGNLDVLLHELGERFEGVNVGPKGYPSCRYTHAPIDAALSIMRQQKLKPEEVEEVTVTLSPRHNFHMFGEGEALAVKRAPKTIVDAQFSVPYTLAAAVMRGNLTLDEMSEASWADAKILDLARRVMPAVDPTFEEWHSDVKPCVVEIKTRSGASHRNRVEYPKGNPRNAVSHDEIRSNFIDFTKRTQRPLPGANGERALELLENLENVSDVREIGALLSGR